MKRAALAALCGAVALSACGTPAPIGAPPLPSADYAEQAAQIAPSITQAAAKQIILKHRSKLFKDPDSVRDAKVSEPFTCLTGSGNCICIEANAKNSFGGFTGIQLLGVQLGTDSVEALGEMAPRARDMACGKLSTFPQLNGRASPKG